MWDLPGPGIEPVSPALAGEFFTVVTAGKPEIVTLSMDREEPYIGLLGSCSPPCPGPREKTHFTDWCLILQTAKGREPAGAPKDGKSLFGGLAPGESSWSQHRQRRLQDHGKERKELLSMTLQVQLGLSVSGTPMGTPHRPSSVVESHGIWQQGGVVQGLLLPLLISFAMRCVVLPNWL